MHTYMCTRDPQRSDFLFSNMISCICSIHQLYPSILQDYSAIIHRKCVRLWLFLFSHLFHSWTVPPPSPPPLLSSFYSHNLTTWASMSCKWRCSFFSPPDLISVKWSEDLEAEGKVGTGGENQKTRWKSRAERRKVIKVRWDWKSDWRPHLINQSCRATCQSPGSFFIGHWGLANVTH